MVPVLLRWGEMIYVCERVSRLGECSTSTVEYGVNFLNCSVFCFFVGLMEILDETSKLCGCMVTRILNVVNRIEPGCTMIMTTKKVEGLCCGD